MRAKLVHKFFDTRLSLIGSNNEESVPQNIFGFMTFDGLVNQKQVNCFAHDFHQVTVTKLFSEKFLVHIPNKYHVSG